MSGTLTQDIPHTSSHKTQEHPQENEDVIRLRNITAGGQRAVKDEIARKRL
jgi:hypothetical protein